MTGAPSLRASSVVVLREGLGELDGDAEPRRAKRAARSFCEGDGGIARLEGEVSKVTEDFLSALRRARRALSCGMEAGMLGVGAHTRRRTLIAIRGGRDCVGWIGSMYAKVLPGRAAQELWVGRSAEVCGGQASPKLGWRRRGMSTDYAQARAPIDVQLERAFRSEGIDGLKMRM
jgi:hypothetical protein